MTSDPPPLVPRPDARAPAWSEVAGALERALREGLQRRFGRSRLVGRIAHLIAQAQLLEGASRVLEQAALELGRTGLVGPTARAHARSRDLLLEAERLTKAARRYEGLVLDAPEPARYAELAERILRLEGSSALRAFANELLQARTKVGARALEALWEQVEKASDERGLRIPADVARRLEEELGSASEEGGKAGEEEAKGEAPRWRYSSRRLFEETKKLCSEAEGLSKQDLFDRIEIVAGRLKHYQEHMLRRGAAEDARLVRRAFGMLTTLSKERQPGFTRLLSSQEKGGDWLAFVREAERRLAERRRALEESRREWEREQRLRALGELRAARRVELYLEALDRLRAGLFHLGAELDEPERERLLGVLRTQAAIAVKASESQEELRGVAALLEAQSGLIARGRDFRRLREHMGLPEPAADSEQEARGSEVADDEDASGVDPALLADVDEELATQWPAEIADAESAGAEESVLLVGGLPDRRRQQRLAAFFGWQAVEWEESYRDHQADFATLRKRIAAGRFDRVVVLSRFCGHDVSFGLRDACRAHDVPYHVHPRGASIPMIARSVYGA